jgi:thioredoxin reductase
VTDLRVTVTATDRAGHEATAVVVATIADASPRRYGSGMTNFGQVAYEAYCKKTGGKSAVTGESLPAWEDQSSEIREAWEAAAKAVTDLTD